MGAEQLDRDQVAVGLFGGLSMGGGSLGTGSRIPKAVWLITALALFPDFRATDRQLEQLLFLEESMSFEDSRARLRQCVLGARKLLGTPESIRREFGSYVLEPAFLCIDIIEFERSAVEALNGEDTESVSEAMRLYRNGGKLLAGHQFPSGHSHPNLEVVEKRLYEMHLRLMAVKNALKGTVTETGPPTQKSDSHPMFDLLRSHAGAETHEVSSSWDESILAIIANATREVFIATDFAAYASFSKPAFFEKYHLLLNQKVSEPRVKVRVHVYDEAIRWILLKKQFTCRWNIHDRALRKMEPPAQQDLDKLPETPGQFRSLLDQFEARRGIESTTTLKLLLDELVREDDEITAAFARSFYFTSGSARMPILMWVVDRKHAVFMSNESDIHFISSDPRLVELLYTIGRSYYSGDIDSNDRY